MKALLGYTRDHLLARRSGYHVLADYLDGVQVLSLPRKDPEDFWAKQVVRVKRRFSVSRWCAGTSFDLEEEMVAQSKQHPSVPVHLLWAERDWGFLHRKLDAPLIATFHQCASEMDQILARPVALRSLKHVILMSETQRAWFIKHGVEKERLHCILHGVDIDYFCPASHDDAAFTVLAVGGTNRNFTLLAAVARELCEEMRFVILGPADKAHHFSALPKVSYLTGVTDDALLRHYQTASCLLHLIEDSTANNVINEAMACGLPIISERHGGVPEYVSDEAGILCEKGDGVAVSTSLRKLAASRSRAAEMRHAARSHALTLDWRISAQQTEQLYAA